MVQNILKKYEENCHKKRINILLPIKHCLGVLKIIIKIEFLSIKLRIVRFLLYLQNIILINCYNHGRNNITTF
jgi:hypothetical protein